MWHGGTVDATNTHSRGRLVQLTRPLDRIDRMIIALLQENAKRSFAEIGSHVGLSPTGRVSNVMIRVPGERTGA